MDDDPDIRAMLEWSLSRSGLDVISAGDGHTTAPLSWHTPRRD